MSKSEILYEKLWYLPTYLKSKTDESGSLIIHAYTIKRTPKGRIMLDNKLDAQTFDNDQELANFIEENDARELPNAADGKPKFVPQEITDLVDSFKTVTQHA